LDIPLEVLAVECLPRSRNKSKDVLKEGRFQMQKLDYATISAARLACAPRPY
jgi:hypothetical protein